MAFEQGLYNSSIWLLNYTLPIKFNNWMIYVCVGTIVYAKFLYYALL